MRLLLLLPMIFALACASPKKKASAEKVLQIDAYCDTDSLRHILNQDSTFRATQQKSQDSLYKFLKKQRSNLK